LSQQIQLIVTANTSGATGPLTQLKTQLGQLPSATGQATTGFTGLTSNLGATGNAARATGGSVQPLTGALAGAGTAAKTTNQSLSPLSTSLGTVAKGGITTNNALVPLQGTMTQTSATSISLGQKMGVMGGFIASTAGSVVGLVSGFFSLAAAQVAVDRAQQRVNTSAYQVTKAQEAYNTAVQKFGPASQQAHDALTNLENKQNALKIAQDRLTVTTDHQKESWMNLGIQLVTVGGSFAQMGSTISILGSKLAGTAAVAATTGAAEVELSATSNAAAEGLTAEAAAAQGAAGATGEASAATMGLGMRMALIAAPIAAAIALFALIETNTFGMGDAFRSTATVIGVGVDAIANDIINLWNQFVGLLNNMATFNAQWNNLWVGAGMAVLNALQSMVKGEQTFVAAFQTAIIDIPNFFIKYVINPIIGAWNNFLKNIQAPVAGALQAILGAFSSMGGAISNAIKALTLGKVDLSQSIKMPELKMPQFQGAQTVGQLPTPDISAAATGSQLLTAAQGELAKQYMNTTSAGRTFDSMLREANITTGEQIAAVVNYYSKGNNLANLLNSNVSPAFKNMIKGLMDMTKGLFGGASAADASSAATGKSGVAASQLSEHLTKLTADTGKNTTEIARRWKELQNGSAFEADYNAGVQETKLQLLDQIDALGKNAGALTELASEQQSGIKYAVDYATGVQQAKKALLDLNDANVTMRGSIEETGRQIQAGTFQFANYQKGVLETGKAYDDAVAKLAQLDAQLSDSTAIMNRHNTAVIQGKTNFEQLVVSTQDATTTNKEYRTDLDNAVGTFSLFNGALEKTTKNMETVAKAALGDEDAMKSLQDTVKGLDDWFFKLADEVGSKLGDALAKGGKAFSKAVKDLTKETGADFKSLGEIPALRMEAGMQAAEKTLKTDIGTMAVLIRQGAPGIAAATDEMIGKLQTELGKQTPQIQKQWDTLFANMRTVAATPPNTIGFVTALGKLKTSMDQLGQPTDDINAQLKQMDTELIRTGKAVGEVALKLIPLSSEAAAAGAAYQAMGDKVDFGTGQIKDASGRTIGYINKVTGAFIPLPGAAQNAFSPMPGYAQTYASAMVPPFTKAVGQIKSILDGLSKFDPFSNVGKAGEKFLGQQGGFFGTSQVKTPAPTQAPAGGAAMFQSMVAAAQAAEKAVAAAFLLMNNTINTLLKQTAANIQVFVRTGLIASLQLGMLQAEKAVSTAFLQMNNNINTLLKQTAANIQVFVRTGLIDSLQLGAQEAEIAVNAAFLQMNNNINTLLKQTTANIQVAVTTGFVNSLQKGAQNTANIVSTNFQTLNNNVNTDLKQMVANIQVAVATGFVNSLQKGAQEAQAAVASAFSEMVSRVNSAMSEIVSSISSSVARARGIIGSLQSSIDSLHGKTVTVNAVIGQNQVGQLQSSINSLHGKTVNVNVVQHVSSVPAGFNAPVSSANASIPSENTTFLTSTRTPVERIEVINSGGSTGSSDVQRLVAIIELMLSKPISFKVDSKTLAQTTMKHMMSHYGAMT